MTEQKTYWVIQSNITNNFVYGFSKTLIKTRQDINLAMAFEDRKECSHFLMAIQKMKIVIHPEQYKIVKKTL